MQLVSVNIGHKSEQQVGSRIEQTGIYKIPTQEPVEITEMGIITDYIASEKHHGGPDQAVYIYGTKDYEWWSELLGSAVLPGTFGENLTISELESASFVIGDRLRVGDVLLEVSAPRIPCNTLAARMGDPNFIKRYRQAERPGLYCRVLYPGLVQVGLQVTLQKYTGDPFPIVDAFRYYYDKNKTKATLHHYLSLPIAIRMREDYERVLASL